MATHKCGCVYADRNNTDAVRKGYEMGGYVKQWCKEHAPTPKRAAAMADTQWNIEHLLATAVAYMRDVGMPNEADAIIELQRRAATPPADAAMADAVAPGVMRCAKCKFGLQRVILSVRSGTASAGNSKTEPCPNGCGPLWPVTWKELAKEHLEVAERFFDESAVLRKDNETLRAELTALRARPQDVVANICNAYESGVCHNGRKTAHVNPYPVGSHEHEAYRIGATGTKHNAQPAPETAGDARDAERYRWLRSQAQTGAVRTLLPLYQSHFVIVGEPVHESPTFDSAVDAAILGARGGA